MIVRDATPDSTLIQFDKQIVEWMAVTFLPGELEQEVDVCQH